MTHGRKNINELSQFTCHSTNWRCC